MIYLDNKELDNLHVGSQEIQKAYVGDKLVWENNRIIVLGQGDEFDVASVYPNYADLTVDNFFFLTQDPTTITGSASAYVDETGHLAYLTIWTGIEKTYDASIGKLTLYQSDTYYSKSTIAPTTFTKKTANMTAVLVTKPDKLIYLGLGMTFNIKNLFPNDYQNYTVDNFIARNWYYENGGASGQKGYLLNGARNHAGSYSGSATTTFIKNYDASTGILNFYYNHDWSTDIGESGTVFSKVYAYLVKRSIQ